MYYDRIDGSEGIVITFLVEILSFNHLHAMVVIIYCKWL